MGDNSNRKKEGATNIACSIPSCLDIYYCHKAKHIFYTIPILEVMKNNFNFGFYLTCTLLFRLPNLDKFD